jgi:hypothetical protein
MVSMHNPLNQPLIRSSVHLFICQTSGAGG